MLESSDSSGERQLAMPAPIPFVKDSSDSSQNKPPLFLFNNPALLSLTSSGEKITNKGRIENNNVIVTST